MDLKKKILASLYNKEEEDSQDEEVVEVEKVEKTKTENKAEKISSKAEKSAKKSAIKEDSNENSDVDLVEQEKVETPTTSKSSKNLQKEDNEKKKKTRPLSPTHSLRQQLVQPLSQALDLGAQQQRQPRGGTVLRGLLRGPLRGTQRASAHQFEVLFHHGTKAGRRGVEHCVHRVLDDVEPDLQVVAIRRRRGDARGRRPL